MPNARDFKDLFKKLEQLEPKIAKGAARKELRSGAKDLQKDELERVPVRTGRTKRAIKVRAMRRKRNRIGYMVIISKREFADVKFYGAFLVFGHTTTAGTEVPPQNFPKETAETQRSQVVDNVVTGLKQRVKEAWEF